MRAFASSRVDLSASTAASATPAALRVLLPLLMALLAACGGGSTRSASEGWAMVGAAGGTVSAADGATLVIPPGALSSDVVIRIARTSAGAPTLPADTGLTAPSGVYEITPHGLEFAVPAHLSFPSSGVADGDAVALVAEQGGEWSTVPATVSGGVATIDRQSLSWFYPTVWNGNYACNVAHCIPFASITSAVATFVPASAATLDARQRYTVTGPAALTIQVDVRAPVECVGSSSMDVQRSVGPLVGAFTSRRMVVTAAPVGLGGSLPGGLTSGRYSFTDTLTAADDGKISLEFDFHCHNTITTRNAVAYAALGVDIAVTPPVPGVTSAPASTTVAEGAPASFAVAATAAGTLTIDWQRSDDGGVTWSSLASGAPTYTLPAAAASDDGACFRAHLCDVVGAQQACVDSSAATLTVTGGARAPAITAQPAAVTTVVGGAATFTVAASGTAPLSYQWYLNGNRLADRSAGASTSGISGASSPSLALSDVQASDAGAYSAVVSNGAGQATSLGAALAVTAPSCAGWCSVPPSGYYTNRLAFGSAQTGIAVGANLLRTTDGGATWQLLPTAFTGGGNRSTFYDVAFVDADTVVIAGTDSATGNGIIYRSTDAGTTWTLVSTTAQAPTSVTFSGQLGLAATFSTLLRTTDGGGTWSTLTPGYNFYAVTFPPPGVVALASVYNQSSGANELRKSIDGGQTWSLVTRLTGWSQYLRRMSFSTSGLGIGVIGASNGTATLARTEDQGATWTILDTGMPGWFNDVLLTPQNLGLAVGTDGGIARSTDAGLSWTSITSGTTAVLRGIAASSASVISVGGDQVMLRNVTGGDGPPGP